MKTLFPKTTTHVMWSAKIWTPTYSPTNCTAYTYHEWWFRKEVRAEFLGEGENDEGIVDFGGGKRVMFGVAVKASFAAEEVWTKDPDSDY